MVIICTFLLGSIFIFLGLIIKFQNAGDMINIFDRRKHDKNKVSRIMGLNLLLIGICVIAIGLFSLFLKEEYSKNIPIIQTCIVVLGLAVGIYKMNKYGKK